eukprot:TRINITY_DN2327_c0_g1_i1.p1 TRINITY_DN2327_c0_g1~~TRINITY_DN2327_c0_g1_i1.p1  ORF type:complete len:115 (-),score=18.61 TRINITY_DN2327_c0_g1_i1:44-388(-)
MQLVNVYSLMIISLIDFHRRCFKCVACQTSIAKGAERVYNGEQYCQRCHVAAEGTRGYGITTSVDSHSRPQLETRTPSRNVNTTVVKSGASNFCSQCGEPSRGGNFCGNCGNRM